MSRSDGADVVVIGGGAIGLAIAWQAAQAGMSVVVADPTPGRGASHVAAGMLAPIAEAAFGEEALLALTLESWRAYPGFVACLEEASGLSAGFSRGGSLLVARDADDNAALEREYRFRARLGLDVERLTGTECRRLEPRLAPTIRGGVLARGDHQIDPRMLVAALTRAAATAGVEFAGGRASLLTDRGRVQAVSAAGRTVACDAVVLAAGAWSAEVEGIPAEARPPVRPVKGQILRLGADGGEPLARLAVRGLEAYVVARAAGGEVVVGATSEERGFDTTVTAGAVHDLLRSARELLPDVAELAVREVSAGLRPATPDGAPLIGETEVAGLLAATGHFRNGILLTPATAAAIVALLRGDPAPQAAAFSPLRFSARQVATA